MSTTFAEASYSPPRAAFESAWFDGQRELVIKYPASGYAQRYLSLSRAAQDFDPRMSTAYLGSDGDGASYFQCRHPDGYESLSSFADYLRDRSMSEDHLPASV